MALYPRIALPTGANAGQIEAWVMSRPVRDLVARFGGAWPTGGLADVLAGLDVFSGRVWDFRAGKERPLAREVVFDAATTKLIGDAAWALGMVEECVPSRATYTYLMILGGLVRACAQRPAYAADVIAGGVSVREVVALGCSRELSPPEAALRAELGMASARTESEAMDAGTRRAFGLGAAAVRSDYVTVYHRGALTVRIVTAPNDENGRRANTGDTYRFWAEHVAGGLSANDRVLVVTSTAYVPFQHCDALRILGSAYGCEVETIGVAPTGSRFTPANYLQEIRSAMRSMRLLYTTSPSA